MLLKSNGKIIASDVEFARSIVSQTRGLMFRKNIQNNYALVFEMRKSKKVSLHMLFVGFPIDVLFLDESKTITRTAKLSPWIGRASSGEKIKYIIEMPDGTISRNDLSVGAQVSFHV
ncbi:MAG: DUF192 domain-containing protein [Methanosarcinaceae archaeon]|nr:DUF192 domain-containing protein [Methanosarcinaceae archaeon]MDF1533952.1 DUF192 domain-containing protein [Methanosarcinaceae archaeon]